MSEVRLTEFRAIKKTEKGTVYIAIDHPPTIDAVEVVRCACCISFMEYTAEDTQAAEGADGDCRIRMNFSDYPDYYAVKKDDYCSYGTRKEVADGRSD